MTNPLVFAFLNISCHDVNMTEQKGTSEEFSAPIEDMVVPYLEPMTEDIAELTERYGLPREVAVVRLLGAVAAALRPEEAIEARGQGEKAQATYLSAGEAAAILGVSPKTVNRWANEGKVPCAKTLGGHRRFRVDVIEAVAQSMGLYDEDNGLDA